MSASIDILVTALGSGGALTTLAAALRTWLEDKNRRVIIRIKSGDKTIVLNTENIDPEALARILQDISGDIQRKAPIDESATD